MSSSGSSAPKSGWVAYTTTDGRPYYFNHTTGESSWTPPAPPRRKYLAPWERRQCEFVNKYYDRAKHVVGPKKKKDSWFRDC